MMVYPCGAICFLYACDKMCNMFARRYISTAVDFIHYSRGNIVELRLKPVPAWPLLHRLASKIPSPFGSHSQREVDAIYFAPGTRMRFAHALRAFLLCSVSSMNTPLRRLRRHPVPRNQRVAVAPFHRARSRIPPSATRHFPALAHTPPLKLSPILVLLILRISRNCVFVTNLSVIVRS